MKDKWVNFKKVNKLVNQKIERIENDGFYVSSQHDNGGRVNRVLTPTT